MRDFLLAVAIFATIAIALAIDNECIERKLLGLPVHWPNPTSCSSFYRCTNANIKREFVCQEGREYNPATGRCASKDKSLCRLSLMKPLKEEVTNPCANQTSGISVANLQNCRSFYICNNKLAYPQQCDLGSYFDIKMAACIPDTNSTCWENLCIGKSNGSFVANMLDCYSFYVCYDEMPIGQRCTDDSYFNKTSLNCQPGKCPEEETTTIPTTTSPTTIPTTTSNPETTLPPTTLPPTTLPPTTKATSPPSTKKPTTTTTPAPKTTTKTKTTTTTTTPAATSTVSTAKTTTSTSTAVTTTTCTVTTTCPTATPTKKTTTCAAVSTTTTTCLPQQTTTPAPDDCPNLKCNSSICLKAPNSYVFPALNTTDGFCACLNQKVEYHQCPVGTVFNETLRICTDKDLICPSSKCYQLSESVTFPASNTTAGFCRCTNGTAIFIACIEADYVYDSRLGSCIKSNKSNDCTEPTTPTTLLCEGRYKEGDFIPNAKNCMLFSICADGKLEEVSCGPGNYYDKNIGACMPDTEGKCPACHQTQLFSDSRQRNKRSVGGRCVEGSQTPAVDCDKYYKCSGGRRLLYGCGKDNFFNVTTLACQLDVENVCCSCTDGSKNPYPDDDTKYYECVNGKQMAFSCGLNGYFNKISKTCITKEECTCPGGYKEGDISAHPTGCDKFYICIDGEQVLHECGKGNYFNTKILSCEKDTKNTCQVEKPCLCPGGYKEGELSPSPSDCDKYYVCTDGKQVLQECGENNYFDNKTLSCEPDIYNECWAKEVCTCPGGYDEGDFSAHPSDCSKYYICHDGQQVLEDCGVDNYFNKDTLTCEPDTYNVCWPNLCAGQPNGALIANPQQCNAFYLCQNNKAIPNACLEGQRFDSVSSACVADLKALCYNPCAHESSGSVVLLPHPICNKYYFCNGRKTFVGTCKVGSFDIATGVCNEQKKCFPNPCDNSSVTVFPDPYDPRKFYWCNSEKQPIPATCQPGTEFNLEYKICKKFSDPDCPQCIQDGSFPTLSNNDNEFCVCVKGLATKIECPADYVFNKAIGTCYSNAPCDPSFCLDAKEYDRAPNRNDVKSFCMCFDKKATIIKCPNNGTFNPYTLQCSNFEISPECLQSTCVGQTTNNLVFKPINPKTSNGFCQCVNQIATFKPCRYGSTFNPDLLICQLPEINCNSYQCRGLADKTIIPSVISTEGYCECIDGVATYHNCPNNGEFNVTTGKCGAPLCDLTKCTVKNTNIPFPASAPDGFCTCNSGYIPCSKEGTLFSEKYLNCIDPCPQTLCNGKPENYLTSSLINSNSFCVCHMARGATPVYEVCPSESFVFSEAKQMCVPDIEQLCGTDVCKGPGAFEAKNTLIGFCLCSEKGKKPTFVKCLEGIYVPEKSACLPTAKDVCDINKCCDATIEHPVTMPANNTVLEFCYCSSPNSVMLLPCPYGKYYNEVKGMCVSHLEDGCSCPNGIKEGQKVADTTTCNKYSICVKGNMESHTCPSGDYFNVNMNDCVPDVKGVCSKKSSQCTCLGIYYENELLPHPVNPQMYYACQGNTLHEYKCQIGYIYSDSQKQCVSSGSLRQKRSIDDHEFECLENEMRSVPSNCSQYEICRQQSWKRETCSNHRYYNPEQRKCLEPRDDFVCSYAKVTTLPTCNASMELYLLKATKNCHQYYQCSGGKWRLNNCGQQQYFNEKKSTCLKMPQGYLKCASLNNITKEDFVKDRQPPTCHNLNQRFYKRNCAMYLICLDNDWWYQYCPANMYYNRSLNYCVHDTNQECSDVLKTEIIPHAEKFPQEVCEEDGLLRPSAMACNRYYICLNGKWQSQRCSSSEYYDVANAECAADKKGLCTQLNKDCLPNEKKAMSHNCSLYETCSNEGKWLKMSCPQHEIFDELLQQCTINQGICSKHGLKRTCRQSETLPVYRNCSMFYYCSQDTWNLGSCLKGFMYSFEKEMCIAHMPEDSCKPLVLNETLPSTIGFVMENNPCQGKPDGTPIAYSHDCSKYYVCIQQTKSHKLHCPKGSFFDSNLKYCRPNDGSCRLPLTGVCANASYESLVPHPSNCQAFYNCSSINGTELLHCPDGEYFHNETNQCRVDHGECNKDLMPKQKCDGFKHGTRLAHETYCNIYYACVKGLSIPLACPNSYHFNSNLKKCVEDKESQCQHGHLANVTYSCNNLSDGTYLPDLRDCTHYYICYQGQALPKKCMNSSYFDNEQLLCVPDDGSCPLVNNEAEQNTPVPPDPIICEGRHGYLMADPLNCNNFYVCINNKLKHERCYAQQFFNATSLQCQQKSTAEMIKITTNATGNLETSKNQKLQCQDETTSFKKLCSELSAGTSLAEPGDCRRYITCQDTQEEPISQRCRNGESFDSLLGFCRQNDGTCLLENGQRVGECSRKHGQFARDSNNCRSYFVCINGQKIAQSCGEDEYFSKTQNSCIKDTEQVCKAIQAPEGPVKQSCVGLSESMLYPYIHDDCHSYFQCVKGEAKVHKCADNLYFDPLAIKCIENKTECVMPTKMQRSPALSQTFAQLCSDKKLEYPYANIDNDCRSFYICHANGEVSHEFCPLDMMFSKEFITCMSDSKISCR